MCKRKSFIFKIIATALIFLLGELNIPTVQAQGMMQLPAAQTNLLGLSKQYSLPVLRGIKTYPNKPFEFDFIVEQGNAPKLDQKNVSPLIKYFLTCLTIPQKDLWVNLSPYEQGRIIPDELSVTEAGNTLLLQDKLLKQMASSLSYPESDLGKKFWADIYKHAYAKYKTTNIPIKTYNKVWIVPDKAIVYDMGSSALIGETHLKVMLEDDYLASRKHSQAPSSFENDITRQIILPQLENEVNTGKNFAPVRQIFYSMLLASWFKRALKRSILSSVYINQKKTSGVDDIDKNARMAIYKQYLQFYKQGAYNYIKEDIDPVTQQQQHRKYFSGGIIFGDEAMTTIAAKPAALAASLPVSLSHTIVELAKIILKPISNKSMLTAGLLIAMTSAAMASGQGSNTNLTQVQGRYGSSLSSNFKNELKSDLPLISEKLILDYENAIHLHSHRFIHRFLGNFNNLSTIIDNTSTVNINIRALIRYLNFAAGMPSSPYFTPTLGSKLHTLLDHQGSNLESSTLSQSPEPLQTQNASPDLMPVSHEKNIKITEPPVANLPKVEPVLATPSTPKVENQEIPSQAELNSLKLGPAVTLEETISLKPNVKNLLMEDYKFSVPIFSQYKKFPIRIVTFNGKTVYFSYFHTEAIPNATDFLNEVVEGHVPVSVVKTFVAGKAIVHLELQEKNKPSLKARSPNKSNRLNSKPNRKHRQPTQLQEVIAVPSSVESSPSETSPKISPPIASISPTLTSKDGLNQSQNVTVKQEGGADKFGLSFAVPEGMSNFDGMTLTLNGSSIKHFTFAGRNKTNVTITIPEPLSDFPNLSNDQQGVLQINAPGKPSQSQEGPYVDMSKVKPNNPKIPVSIVINPSVLHEDPPLPNGPVGTGVPQERHSSKRHRPKGHHDHALLDNKNGGIDLNYSPQFIQKNGSFDSNPSLIVPAGLNGLKGFNFDIIGLSNRLNIKDVVKNMVSNPA